MTEPTPAAPLTEALELWKSLHSAKSLDDLLANLNRLNGEKIVKISALEERVRALTAALDQSNADNDKMRAELLKRHEQDIRDGDRDSEGW